MRLFIPTIGTKLKLERDWTFDLHDERRNESLLKAFGITIFQDEKDRVQKAQTDFFDANESKIFAGSPGEYNRKILDYGLYEKWLSFGWHKRPPIPPVKVTLDAGTVLQVDRIFIRQKMADFDSVSFYIDSSPDPHLQPKGKRGFLKGNIRFWAKLDDVNTIECEVV